MESSTVTCREKKAEWCIVPVVVVVGCSGDAKLWSNPLTWATDLNPAGGVPDAGQDVQIPPGVIITFDLAESPIYNLIRVNGCLNFLTDNSKDQNLQAY